MGLMGKLEKLTMKAEQAMDARKAAKDQFAETKPYLVVEVGSTLKGSKGALTGGLFTGQLENLLAEHYERGWRLAHVLSHKGTGMLIFERMATYPSPASGHQQT